MQLGCPSRKHRVSDARTVRLASGKPLLVLMLVALCTTTHGKTEMGVGGDVCVRFLTIEYDEMGIILTNKSSGNRSEKRLQCCLEAA
jgi:hypothetical protein